MFENGSPKGSDYECTICAFKCSEKYKYNRHLSTAKHRKGAQKQEIFEQNGGGIFECITCNYKCNKQSNLDRHMLTEKHMNNVNSNAVFEKAVEKGETSHPTSAPYMCKCGKTYTSRSSLWYHKKQCQIDIDYPKEAEKVNRVFPVSHTFAAAPDDTSMETMLFNLLKEQTERSNKMEERYAEQMAVQAAKAEEQTRLFVDAISLQGPQCITNNNTTNNQFNLNVFLNEDCKDAFTLKEVIDSIECTVMDLDRMDTDGYAATITRKILESMQHMSITERPIHCTDARRNTVVVKDETGWERNEVALKCLNDSVYRVGCKLGSMVDDWRVTYPEHFRGTVSRREQYHRLISDVIKVGDLEIEARIASKLCKGIILDRKAAKA
jgi:hypothetical protein